MIPSSSFIGILTRIWPHACKTAVLITIATIYSASSGTLEAVQSAPMMALSRSANVGHRTGMYITIVSFGLLMGLLISGTVNHLTGSYINVRIFTGWVPRGTHVHDVLFSLVPIYHVPHYIIPNCHTCHILL